MRSIQCSCRIQWLERNPQSSLAFWTPERISQTLGVGICIEREGGRIVHTQPLWTFGGNCTLGARWFGDVRSDGSSPPKGVHGQKIANRTGHLASNVRLSIIGSCGLIAPGVELRALFPVLQCCTRDWVSGDDVDLLYNPQRLLTWISYRVLYKLHTSITSGLLLCPCTDLVSPAAEIGIYATATC